MQDSPSPRLLAAAAGAVLAAVAFTASAPQVAAEPTTSASRLVLDVSRSQVAPLVDAGYVAEVDGDWYVDGARVAGAAEQLRTVSSSRIGYDRDLFGAWSDPDGNGCDTRNDILRRDLSSLTFEDGDDCVVQAGSFTDPYTGQITAFQRGQTTSGAVHIDHIVPLAAAWTGGASAWDADRRAAFANDPVNLQAADGRANSSKGARLASEWLPPNAAFHCTYVAQTTNVLVTYDLAVTAIDRAGLVDQASECGLPRIAAPVTGPAETTSPMPAAEDARGLEPVSWVGMAVAAVALAVAGVIGLTRRTRRTSTGRRGRHRS